LADRVKTYLGTDHPFFPPLDQDKTQWLSVKLNSDTVQSVFKGDEEMKEAVMGGNAMRILRLEKQDT
jgi:aminocarboxymuconate-semialdehyde decarboxylase